VRLEDDALDFLQQIVRHALGGAQVLDELL